MFCIPPGGLVPIGVLRSDATVTTMRDEINSPSARDMASDFHRVSLGAVTGQGTASTEECPTTVDAVPDDVEIV